MTTLWERPVFSVDGRSYDWSDVVLAAALWGEWNLLAHQAAEGVAWCARADPAAVRVAAEQFRQRRGLLAGDDMRGWLDRWQLTAEEWMDYLRRQTRPPGAPNLAADPDEVAPALHAEAVCSGRLEAWATKLAGQATAAGDEPADDHAPLTLDPVPLGFPPLAPDELSVRMARLRAAERGCLRFESSAVTADAVQREITVNRLAWARLDCQLVAVATEDAAREVALSLRRRERTLDQLATAAGVPTQQETVRLDVAPPELVGARPGEVLGPLRRGPDFLVLEVTGKAEPSVDDPEIRAAAARILTERAVRRLVNERVTWDDPV